MQATRACLQIATGNSNHFFTGEKRILLSLWQIFILVYIIILWELWFECREGACQRRQGWFSNWASFLFQQSWLRGGKKKENGKRKDDYIAWSLLWQPQCFAENKKLRSQREFKALGNPHSLFHSQYPVPSTDLPPAEQSCAMREHTQGDQGIPQPFQDNHWSCI